MKCPNCKSNLLPGEKKSYETLADHVSDPNRTPPFRPTFVCCNKSCELHDNAFWDETGDYYGKVQIRDWYYNNRIDLSDHKTYKNKGAEAIGSSARDTIISGMKYNQGFIAFARRISNKIRTKIGNWSCDIRRRYLPDAIWRDNNKWWRKIGYSFGVFLMDPVGNRWKLHARYMSLENAKDDHCIKQWLYHPYPWVRWSLRKFLSSNKK